MHRATPLNTSHRAFSAGGARSVVGEVDDGPLMQEMKGGMMKGESRKELEAPQNYGFTSVTADGDKGKDGQVTMGPETIINFAGGNRSFPIAGAMDDRRHRLLNLIKDAAKGSTAMFGLKEWGQQFLNTDTGLFLTGNVDKKIRLALVENQNGKKQTQQPGQAKLARTFRSRSSGVEFDIETFEVSSGGSSSSSDGNGAGGSSKPTGQKTLHKEESKHYLEITKDKTDFVHDKSINYKTGTHTFSPPDSSSGASARDGNPLVKILGDQMTQGFGNFTKQVSAAGPTAAEHLTTKAYVDAAIAAGGGGGGGTPYTDEQAQDAAAAMIKNGPGVTWTYDDANNTLTPTTDWTTVPNKPTSFPPSPHQHAMSDVSGLQTSLSAKADTTYVDAQDAQRVAKAGDTMTGLLTLFGPPTVSLHAATKQYVDDKIATVPPGYTDEQAQDAAAAMIQNGPGITWTYNDAANTLTPTTDWTTIPNRPATFPPSAHQHPISDVTGLQGALDAKEATANKGVANGYASLDATAKVPAAQLPAYVDDVVEYANLAAFPATGTAGILYVALDTNKLYRWSTTSGSLGPPPLDVLAGVTGGYSASRQLASAYSGAFYNLTSGKVDTLFDQSGNGRNMIQAQTAYRPSIVKAGTANVDALDITPAGIHVYTGSTPISTFISAGATYAVASIIIDAATGNDPTVYKNHGVWGDHSGNIGTYIKLGPKISAYNWDTNADEAPAGGANASLGTSYVVELRHETGNLYQRINGGTWSTAVPSGNTVTLTGILRLGMGWSTGNLSMDGKIFEFVIFNTIPTPTQQDALVANMMAYIGAGSPAGYVEVSPPPTSSDQVGEGTTNLYYTAARSALKADLASPVFTGDPRAPTPTAGDNDTSIATTAFVTGAITTVAVPPATALPLMDGAAAVGTATKYAREDHKHPTDTSRESTITAGTTAQYWRGDKSWQTLDKTAVGLGNVANVAQVTAVTGTAPVVSSGGTTPAISLPPATGSANGYLASADWTTFNGKEPPIAAGTSAQYWRGDKTWQTLNTANVAESTNLYYTDERVDDRVAGLLQAGTNITLAYNDVANTLTINSTAAGGGGGATISDTPPASPTAGQLWWESDSGATYIYYTDANSSQWVQVADGGGALADAPADGVTYARNNGVWTPVANLAVRYDAAQTLTAPQQQQARQNIYAAPFEAMAFNGFQVNGGFEVMQASAPAALAPSTSTSNIDCWTVYNSTPSGTFTPSQGGAVLGSSASLTITVNTASGAFVAGSFGCMQTNIETYRILRGMPGQPSALPITLGFWIWAVTSGGVGVAVRNGAVRSCVKVISVTGGVWQYKTVTFPGDTAGTWNLTNNAAGLTISFCFGSGAQYQTTPANDGVWIAGNFFTTTAQTNFLTGSTGAVLAFASVGAWFGSEAPDQYGIFRALRPYDQELMLCRRYYVGETFPAGSFWAYSIDPSAGYRRNSYRFNPPLRATPASVAVTANTSATFAANQPAVDSTNQFVMDITADITTASGYSYITSIIANARI